MSNNSGTFINFFAGISGDKDIPSRHMEAVLVNVPHVTKNGNSLENTKKIIKKTGAKYKILDSGGFTIFNTFQKNGNVQLDGTNILIGRNNKQTIISSNHIIEAALNLRPNIMVGLDYPVIKTKDLMIQEEEFQKKKDINIKWMKEISDLRKVYCPDIELYLPIQCYNLEQFGFLEDDLLKLKFEGLALPTRNMNAMDITMFLLRMDEIGIRKVHLLGTSSFTNIALATYFARNVFERCSIDSTTWSTGIRYHQYINPNTLTKVRVGRKSTANENEKLPCRCDSCEGNTYGHIMNLGDKERREYLKQHNYLTFNKVGDDFFNHAGDHNEFDAYLRKRAPGRDKDINKIMCAIRMIDDSRDINARNRRRPRPIKKVGRFHVMNTNIEKTEIYASL